MFFIDFFDFRPISGIAFLVFSWPPGRAIAHGLRMVLGAMCALGERWSFSQPGGREVGGNIELSMFIVFFTHCIVSIKSSFFGGFASALQPRMVVQRQTCSRALFF